MISNQLTHSGFDPRPWVLPLCWLWACNRLYLLINRRFFPRSPTKKKKEGGGGGGAPYWPDFCEYGRYWTQLRSGQMPSLGGHGARRCRILINEIRAYVWQSTYLGVRSVCLHTLPAKLTTSVLWTNDAFQVRCGCFFFFFSFVPHPASLNTD